MPLRQTAYLRGTIIGMAVFLAAEGATLIANPANTESGLAWAVLNEIPVPYTFVGTLLFAAGIAIPILLLTTRLLPLCAVMAVATFVQAGWAFGFFLAATQFGDGGWFGSEWLLTAAGFMTSVTAHTYRLTMVNR